MFINVQTGEAFVNAEFLTGPKEGVLLTREDGSTKEVSMISFKAWYQEDEEERPDQKMVPMPGTEDPDWGEKHWGGESPKKPKPKTKPKQSLKPRREVGEIGEDEVIVRAFTGMLIGVFKIHKQTKTTLTVKKADGSELKFDKKTGKQIGAKNPRFANAIEIKTPVEAL